MAAADAALAKARKVFSEHGGVPRCRTNATSEAAARSENCAITLVGSPETWVFVNIDGAGSALCDGTGL